ncbi:MAG: ABC transporter permease [Oscillospiraceae bacterium]|nr:ABC transporter permease [Oscillospiraceae bacterium]
MERSAWKVMWNEIRHDAVAMTGLILFILIMASVYIWSLFIDEQAMMIANFRFRNIGPSPGVPFGFDSLGRDMLPHLIISARNSFNMAYVVTVVGVAFGTLVGLFSGFYGGHVDNVLMRVLDFWGMIPALMLIIVFVSTMPGYTPIHFALMFTAIYAWQGTARLIRSMAFRQASLEYVAASKTLGTPNAVIIFREITPNLVSIMTANLTIQLAANIGFETGLTFLGFGVPFGTPSLGLLVYNAATPQALRHYWWQWLPAALLIVIVMLCINFIGQALNRAADAKKRSI